MQIRPAAYSKTHRREAIRNMPNGMVEWLHRIEG